MYSTILALGQTLKRRIPLFRHLTVTSSAVYNVKNHGDRPVSRSGPPHSSPKAPTVQSWAGTQLTAVSNAAAALHFQDSSVADVECPLLSTSTKAEPPSPWPILRPPASWALLFGTPAFCKNVVPFSQAISANISTEEWDGRDSLEHKCNSTSDKYARDA